MLPIHATYAGTAVDHAQATQLLASKFIVGLCPITTRIGTITKSIAARPAESKNSLPSADVSLRSDAVIEFTNRDNPYDPKTTVV